MAVADDDKDVPAVEGSKDGDPEDQEDYADAVTRHAKYLGIDPGRHSEYLWIAEEALNADVPEGWVTGEGEGEYEGLVYYYHEATGQSTWDHPLDEYYREKFKKKKAKDKERKRQHSRSSSKRATKSRTSRSSSRARHDSSKRRDSSGGRSRRSRRRDGDSYSPDREQGQSLPVKEREIPSPRKHRSRSSGEGSKHSRRRDRDPNGLPDGQRQSDEGEKRKEAGGRENRKNDDSHRSRIGDGDKSGRKHDHRGGDHEGEAFREKRGRRNTKDNHQGRRTRSRSSSVSSSKERGVSISPDDGRGQREEDRRGTDRAGRSSEGNRIIKDKRESRSASDDDPKARKRGKSSGSSSTQRNKKDHSSNEAVDREIAAYESENAGGSNGGDQHLRGKPKRASDRHESGKRMDATYPMTVDQDTAKRAHRRADAAWQEGDWAAVEVSAADDTNALDSLEHPKEAARDRPRKGGATHRGGGVKSAPPTKNSKDTEGGGVGAEGIDELQEIDFEEGLLKMQGEEHEDALLLDSQHEPSKKPVIKSGSTMARLDRENDRASSQTSSSKSIEEVELVEEPSDRYPNNESGRLGAQEGARSPERGSRGKTTRHRKQSSLGSVTSAPRNNTAERQDRRNKETDQRAAFPQTETDGQEDRSKRKGLVATNHKHKSSKNSGSMPGGNRERSAGHYGSDDPEWDDADPGQEPPPVPTEEIVETDEWPTVTETNAVDIRLGEVSWEGPTGRRDSRYDNSPAGRGDGGGYVNPRTARGGRTGGNNRGSRHVEDSWDGEEGWGHGKGRDQRKGGARVTKTGGRGDFPSGGGRGSHPETRPRYNTPERYVDEGMANEWGIRRGDHIRESQQQRHHDGGEMGIGRNRHSQGEEWEGERWGRSERGRLEKEEREFLARSTRALEEKVVRLESDLALSKSREDNLREESADAARRENAIRKQHSQALDEEEKKIAKIEKKLGEATSEIRKMELRHAEAERIAGVDARETASIEWQSKMAEADISRKETQEALRRDLDVSRERANAAEEALARKEEEGKEIGIQSVKSRLARSEEELEAQGKELEEGRRRYAEASAKAATSLREAHQCRDHAEKLRLEVAESSARASTAEAALAQAARDTSALNDALSGARKEIARGKENTEKSTEEALGLSRQLVLAQEKANNAEDSLLREKASFESLAEGLRARTAELESANASVEREMRNAQQDALARLRESERQRDAALYEAKRSTEQAALAEAWRTKDAHRAEAAESSALASCAEAAELRSETARLRAGADAAISPHLKRHTELQMQLDEARREAAKLAAQEEIMKAKHAADIASLKEEVSSKLPQIAEKAVAEAGRQWRRRMDEQMVVVKNERDQRLKELQAAVVEAEAKRHADLADVKVDADRFRAIAEKLAAENRSIRQELGRLIASSKTPVSTPSTQGASVRGDARTSTIRSPGAGDSGGWSKSGTAWEGALHAQVLQQVEAHINSLRAHLNVPSGQSSLKAVGVDTGRYSGGSPVPQQCGPSGVDTVPVSTPSAVETRGNYHVSPTAGKECGLTEIEDLRLSRLLRATNSSSPDKGRSTIGSATLRGNDVQCGDDEGSLHSRRRSADQGGSFHDGRGIGNDSPLGIGGDVTEALRPDDVSWKLFTSPDGNNRERTRRARAGRHVGTTGPGLYAGEEEEDDLEDISDGGYHSGCWRRKYASGEMR